MSKSRTFLKPALLLALITCPSLYSLDLTFEGSPKAHFPDLQVKRKCGKNTREISMRATVEPNWANQGEKLIVLTSEAQPEFENRPTLRITIPYSRKLANYAKNHGMVNVVFTEKWAGRLIKETAAELELCSIEGQTLSQWQ